MTSSRHTDLPRSDRTPYPRRALLRLLRPFARFVIRRRFAVRVHGIDLVPTEGPVILAANHASVMDGPILAIFGPRLVHALTKIEMFRGILGRILTGAGQVPLDRFRVDPAAVKMCLRVLRDDGVVAIFPEGSRGCGDFERFQRGAAYLALVSGAPVVPVVFLGSREPGGHTNSLPRRGGVVDMVIGAPYTLSAAPWPRTREQVERTSMLLREHLLVHLDYARALTGRDLPGPLPAGEFVPDPVSGVTEPGVTEQGEP